MVPGTWKKNRVSGKGRIARHSPLVVGTRWDQTKLLQCRNTAESARVGNSIEWTYNRQNLLLCNIYSNAITSNTLTKGPGDTRALFLSIVPRGTAQSQRCIRGWWFTRFVKLSRCHPVSMRVTCMMFLQFYRWHFWSQVILRPATVSYLEQRWSRNTDSKNRAYHRAVMRLNTYTQNRAYHRADMGLVSGGTCITLASPLHVFHPSNGVTLNVRHELSRFRGDCFTTLR